MSALAHRIISLRCGIWSLPVHNGLWQAVRQANYDGVDAPPSASMCQSGGVEHHLREASLSEVITIVEMPANAG
jgi:hypothetical protein